MNADIDPDACRHHENEDEPCHECYMICREQYDELTTKCKELESKLYYYPPTEPFASDGVTWEQRCKELEKDLAHETDMASQCDIAMGIAQEKIKEQAEEIERLGIYKDGWWSKRQVKEAVRKALPNVPGDMLDHALVVAVQALKDNQ